MKQLILPDQKISTEAKALPGEDSVDGLFAVIREWLEVAKMEDVLSKAERDHANAAMARARAGTLRNCARELSEYISANVPHQARPTEGRELAG